jgi:hypothetical protein
MALESEDAMTIEYLEQGKKEATKRMQAARVLRDSAKTKKARNAAYDDFLFWQDKLAFFAIELKATVRQ